MGAVCGCRLLRLGVVYSQQLTVIQVGMKGDPKKTWRDKQGRHFQGNALTTSQ